MIQILIEFTQSYFNKLKLLINAVNEVNQGNTLIILREIKQQLLI